MKFIFRMKSVNHEMTMLSKHINVASITDILKSSYGQSYFSAISIPDSRIICPGYSWYQSSGGKNLRHMKFICYEDPIYDPYYCRYSRRWEYVRPDPIWEFEILIDADDRYIKRIKRNSVSDDGSPDWELDHRSALFDDSPISMELKSSENRSGFERDIELMMESFIQKRESIRKLHIWDKKGLSLFILCQCGHSASKEILSLDYANRFSDNIFDMEKHLACQSCGVKGKAKLIPRFRVKDGFYSPSEPAFYINKKENKNYPNSVRNSCTSDIYDAIGGDGVNDTYLSDGLSMGPSGRLKGD